MDALFEQNIVQNEALGAEALWYTVAEGFEASDRVRGIHLPLIFLVLPIVFHRRSAQVLAGRTQPGALYKALAADRELAVGLQSRMQNMWGRTQRALTLAVSGGLVEIDSADFELTPRRKTSPINHVSAETKLIMASARRVGQAFVEMTPVQVMTHLNVRF